MKTTRSEPRARARRRLGVVLVEALPVVRAGLRLLLDQGQDVEVLAETGSVEGAMEALRRLRGSRLVVVVALGLPGPHDAYWLIRALRERVPSAAVLVCGAHADAMSVSRALFVGADGYVDKGADPAEFLRAIRAVAEGEVVLVGPPAGRLGEIADGIERTAVAGAGLTGREVEVLAAAAEGLTAREIARRLGVAERTVTTHLARIYGKLGVNSRVGAVMRAARSGLVTVGAGE